MTDEQTKHDILANTYSFEVKRSTPYGVLTIPLQIDRRLADSDPFGAAMLMMTMADEAEVSAVEQRRKQEIAG